MRRRERPGDCWTLRQKGSIRIGYDESKGDRVGEDRLSGTGLLSADLGNSESCVQ
jgi:hypothetical protein